MKQQQGFTLIELIVVIVILGILAATAMPKFADLQVDARMAKINGALASVKSAAALAHSAQLVISAASNASVTLEGQTVTMINGYPTADFAGIGVAAGLSTTTAFSGDWVAGTGTTTPATTFMIAPDSGHTTCNIGYSAAPGTGVISPTFSNTQATRTNC